MKLHILGSSSKGNGYVLEAKNSALLLECGVHAKELVKSNTFDKVVGAVVSHVHGDHAGYIKEYLNRGIRIANNVVEHHNSIPIQHLKKITIEDWSVIPLKMVHDVECFGFLINHIECGTVFFATDTDSIPYQLKGVSHAIIESNYTQEKLDNKQVNQQVNHYLATRIENSHLSFEDCKQWVLKGDLKSLESVVLIHLSDSNSEAQKYVNELQESIGIPVQIANKGEILILNF